jgi:hypothetical protein
MRNDNVKSIAANCTPAPAQDGVDQAMQFVYGQRRASAPRASLRMVETVAMTAELAAEIREAQAQLAEEVAGDVVLLTRDERAALVGSRPTAQRAEQSLVELGLAELCTYTLSGPSTKGRRGALRITPAGRQALAHNESVIFSATSTNDRVTPSAKQSAKPAIAPSMNTLVGDSGHCPPSNTLCVLSAAAAPLRSIVEPGGTSYDPALVERARRSPNQPPRFAAMRAKSPPRRVDARVGYTRPGSAGRPPLAARAADRAYHSNRQRQVLEGALRASATRSKGPGCGTAWGGTRSR